MATSAAPSAMRVSSAVFGAVSDDVFEGAFVGAGASVGDADFWFTVKVAEELPPANAKSTVCVETLSVAT